MTNKEQFKAALESVGVENVSLSISIDCALNVNAAKLKQAFDHYAAHQTATLTAQLKELREENERLKRVISLARGTIVVLATESTPAYEHAMREIDRILYPPLTTNNK